MTQSWLSPFLAGVLFALGLILSGMTLPHKVIAFLDVGGNWDPSLALVMGGALTVFGILQPRICARPRPFWALRFQLPTRRDIDLKLLLGATLFGVGWGLIGYCPGPALTSLFHGGQALLFAPAMVVGMWLHDLLARTAAGSSAARGQEETSPPNAGGEDG